MASAEYTHTPHTPHTPHAMVAIGPSVYSTHLHIRALWSLTLACEAHVTAKPEAVVLMVNVDLREKEGRGAG